MRAYRVLLPLTGSVLVDVIADSERSAIETALGTEFRASIEGDGVSLEECETIEKVVRDGTCYAACWRAQIIRQTEGQK